MLLVLLACAPDPIVPAEPVDCPIEGDWSVVSYGSTDVEHLGWQIWFGRRPDGCDFELSTGVEVGGKLVDPVPEVIGWTYYGVVEGDDVGEVYAGPDGGGMVIDGIETADLLVWR